MMTLGYHVPMPQPRSCHLKASYPHPSHHGETKHWLTLTSLAVQLFSQRQKGQLDVYGLWGVLRGQLLTDDSFVFNKVLKRIKESIQHLPDVTEEDEVALLRVKVCCNIHTAVGWVTHHCNDVISMEADTCLMHIRLCKSKEGKHRRQCKVALCFTSHTQHYQRLW